MYAQNAQDLLTKIATVPALSASVGLSVGGQTPDPAMSKIPLPAAWVLLADDIAKDPDTGLIPMIQHLNLTYVVMIYLPYIGQSDLLTNQYPLLEAVRSAIHGTTAPSGFRWKYQKAKLVLINPGRIAYEQRYTLDAAA